MVELWWCGGVVAVLVRPPGIRHRHLPYHTMPPVVGSKGGIDLYPRDCNAHVTKAGRAQVLQRGRPLHWKEARRALTIPYLENKQVFLLHRCCPHSKALACGQGLSVQQQWRFVLQRCVR